MKHLSPHATRLHACKFACSALFALATTTSMVKAGGSRVAMPVGEPSILFEQRGPGVPFDNWETPHVHPLDMTPDRQLLLACNTPDGRLEVFNISTGVPVPVGSVSVGIDPVSVRARSNTEAWVVNHISDSISVVDLTTMRVTHTIQTKDEPCDVVFAGVPPRAFVTCSLPDLVQVFDTTNPGTAVGEVALRGEDPRAMAVSADGTKVYVAVFESGNGTTVLGGGSAIASTIAFPPNIVGAAGTPYGTVNPAPNNGTVFNPPKNPANGTPPRVSLIVRKSATGQWLDDNGSDWTQWVSGPLAAQSGRLPGWDLPDRDLAIIDTGTLSVTYATRLMNINMALAVHPATGVVTVVGTDATNEVRFEPVLDGKFLRVLMASVDPNTLGRSIVDLNPHLSYTTSNIPQAQRNRSLGDPRGIVWNSAGSVGYVSGMGSNNVAVIATGGARTGVEQISVGEGPTGIGLDEPRARLYVLNKFAGSISVIDTNAQAELARVPFFDPTPGAIKVGRKHLYNTHRNSGLGHIACASCHVDARTDRLGWDLGDPAGAIQPLVNLNLGFGLPGLSPPSANPPFAPFHPMKGPMTTQTLQDIIGHEPLHWRGDRSGIEQFAGAFQFLQGDDAPLGASDMQEFEDFLATIKYPPNPFRNLDNSLPTNLPLPGHYRTGRFGNAGQPLPNGNAVNGLNIYMPPRRLDSGTFACVTCHTLPTGMGTDFTFNGFQYVPIAPGPMGERHLGMVSVDGVTNVSMKVAQTRNMQEKTGFNTTQLDNTSGFGYLHDGSVDSIERFVSEPVFQVQNDQEVADLTAFMLAFSGSDLPQGSTTNPLMPPGPPSKDSHAGVGQQITFNGVNNSDPLLLARFNLLMGQVNLNRLGLFVKGRVGGEMRGWYRTSAGVMQSDRNGQSIPEPDLRALAGAGSELTYTFITSEAIARRMGVDRDSDGHFDRTELDAGSNPNDPNSVPRFCDSIDYNADGLFPDTQDVEDFISVFAGGPCSTPTCGDIDFNNDGLFPDTLDVESLLSVFAGGPCL